MRRGAWAGVLASVLTLVAAAPAGAWLVLGADATTNPGRIGFLIWGSGTFTRVDVSERVDGTDVPVRSVTIATGTGADGQVYSGQNFKRLARWRCDRTTRVFRAVGHREDGSTEVAGDYSVRTPSCRNRLTLTAPREARPGSRVTVRVRDRFRLGGLDHRLCVRRPQGARRCRTLHMADGRSVADHAFRATRKGRWRLSLSSPEQRLRSVVSVGVPPPAGLSPLPVVLTTGDSLMQSVDSVLGDRLTDRAQVLTDVHIGTGLSKRVLTRWSELPGRQVRRHRPEATVVFLGTNDGWPMILPDGTEENCCSEAWIAEYARRARRAMKTYLRRQRGAVIWLNIPTALDAKRKAPYDAVNAGLARAVAGLERAAVLDMADLFTPGGVYREFMMDRGRRVRVRQGDGVHLSAAGAAIAARAVVRELERLGVV